MATMQNTVRAVIAYHQNLEGYDMARMRGGQQSGSR
jgi:hypothetical protein